MDTMYLLWTSHLLAGILLFLILNFGSSMMFQDLVTWMQLGASRTPPEPWPAVHRDPRMHEGRQDMPNSLCTMGGGERFWYHWSISTKGWFLKLTDFLHNDLVSEPPCEHCTHHLGGSRCWILVTPIWTRACFFPLWSPTPDATGASTDIDSLHMQVSVTDSYAHRHVCTGAGTALPSESHL